MDSKCSCQFCNGHIAFEPKDVGRTVACPHCGMDTKLFTAPPPSKAQTSIQAPKRDSVFGLNIGKTNEKIESFITGRFEKFVFALVRFFAVFWAAVVVLLFWLCTVNYIGTFFPAKDDANQPNSLLSYAIQSPRLANFGIYLGVLFILFCVLTMISLVLLLLAIERNTRKTKQ